MKRKTGKSTKYIFERLLWFHNQITAGEFLNAQHIRERYNISNRTAQRDITFLRNRLKAPLIYDFDNKGYYYFRKFKLWE